jgi:hypothetical protein
MLQEVMTSCSFRNPPLVEKEFAFTLVTLLGDGLSGDLPKNGHSYKISRPGFQPLKFLDALP